MVRLVTSTLAVLILVSPAIADDYIGLVKKGNEALNAGDTKKALEYYHSAETELPASPELEYNMGGAIYQQGGYEEAVDKYTRAINTSDIGLEAQVHYNLGNTYFRMGDFQNAIQSYQNALNLVPDDVDAKFNLELARKRLKDQMQPENQQQDQQQEQQQQEQQEQQQQDQDQQDQDQQQEEQQNQPQNDQQDQQQEQQQPQPEDQKEMSKEDAERILNALNDDEQDVQKKIKRNVRAGGYTGKDW